MRDRKTKTKNASSITNVVEKSEWKTYEMPKCKQKWRMKNVILIEKEDEETGFVMANVFVHTENNMRSLVWL